MWEGGRDDGRKSRGREGGREDTDQHADKPVVVNQKLYYCFPSVGADSNSTKFRGGDFDPAAVGDGHMAWVIIIQSTAWKSPFS